MTAAPPIRIVPNARVLPSNSNLQLLLANLLVRRIQPAHHKPTRPQTANQTVPHAVVINGRCVNERRAIESAGHALQMIDAERIALARSPFAENVRESGQVERGATAD